MDIKEIKELKDRVYELEGLLELAQLREDKIPELEPLIKARLHSLCGNEEETVEEEEIASAELEQSEDAAGKPDAKPESIVSSSDSLFSESEFAPVNEEKADEEFVEYSVLPEDEEPVTAKPASGMHISYPAQEQLPSGDFSSTSKKPAFCLNDRFRFRRELFGNSDAEFSAAMNTIASMENYEEAEEYFLGELGWNPENEDVADFLAIIAQYFEKH